MALMAHLSPDELVALRLLLRTDGWGVLVQLVRSHYEHAKENLSSFKDPSEAYSLRGKAEGLRALLSYLSEVKLITGDGKNAVVGDYASTNGNVGQPDKYDIAAGNPFA